MGFRHHFATGLAWRVLLILVSGYAFLKSIETTGLGVTRLVAAAILVGSVAILWRYVQRTNEEITRFVEAIRFGDFSQRFRPIGGSGFDELGEVLNDGMKRLADERQRVAGDSRFYEAVLDDAPTALLIVEHDDQVALANKAARRLLRRHAGVRVEDFQAYGQAFAKLLASATAGTSRLVPITFDAVPQMAMVSAAIVQRLSGAVRVVAVQPIQSELNAVEIAAQSDLVRVLTHEIMNSITPVTSLAQSAVHLMQQADDGEDENIANARAAVETLARRADGIMSFVESYRQISRVPALRRKVYDVAPWAAELETLFRASTPAPVDFSVGVEGPLTLDADPDLLSQVILNLLRNAAQAANGHRPDPRVSLTFSRSARSAIQIDVVDNGPGVPENLQKDIFLPFFTTKEKGSGVGLSLARQIVLAHGGSLAVMNRDGALFRILI